MPVHRMLRSYGITKIVGVGLAKSSREGVMENAAPDDSKDDKDGLKHSLVRVLIYSLGAGIVFLSGKLSWWLALLLFVVLAFYILVELIVGGAIFILIALILRIFFPAFTDYRVLRSEKFGELQSSFKSLVIATILVILPLAYYLFILVALGYYLFFKS